MLTDEETKGVELQCMSRNLLGEHHDDYIIELIIDELCKMHTKYDGGIDEMLCSLFSWWFVNRAMEKVKQKVGERQFYKA